jgi:rhamnosyltransferase
MAGAVPAASVVIRSFNEVRWLGRVIDRVLEQTVQAEVVVVDSGSTDGTLEVARARPVTVVTLKPEDFTFGRALNIGFEAAAGEVVVALSAHALPADSAWLERLLAPFVEPTVAAAYGRQLPHADLDPFRAREVLDYWGDERRDDSPDRVRYSNSNGALRRRQWEQHPFDEAMPYSEDDEWATWALAQGQRVVYVPEAAVYHSHTEGPVAWYRRQRAQAAAAGWPHPARAESLRRYAVLARADLRLVARRPSQWRWVPLGLALRAAEVLGIRAGTSAGVVPRG